MFRCPSPHPPFGHPLPAGEGPRLKEAIALHDTPFSHLRSELQPQLGLELPAQIRFRASAREEPEVGGVDVQIEIGVFGSGWLNTFVTSKRNCRFLLSVRWNRLFKLASKRQRPGSSIEFRLKLPRTPGVAFLRRI